MTRVNRERFFERCKPAASLTFFAGLAGFAAYALWGAWAHGEIWVRHGGSVSVTEHPGAFWFAVAVNVYGLAIILGGIGLVLRVRAGREPSRPPRPPFVDEARVQPFDER
ncbi:hypothetical protein [Aureimonas leprariae]|uniref:Uncharacterized protein n=1 Tax=Plantimonas leprariae TaxID=2615207 RepID=A0A7V7PNG7_9HYPH|nr:hypothetical protein [Aureimonas leprariae]KAB0679258.1 hypothetical protein F6X38_13015 [Aureimonas leprariae]